MPLTRLRAALRDVYFRFVDKTVRHQRGRSILARALRGIVQAEPPIDACDLEAEARPYPELGRAREAAAPGSRTDPIFVTGRFRSGSTFLWNVFRSIPGITAYYEPLNERRWFDPACRGDRVDATHRHVTDYWREYDGLAELGAWYRREWIDTDLYMDERFDDPELKRYVEILIDRARGTAVLQFNRVDFRLSWLRRTFPQARFVHVFRHPRDQWCSTLQGGTCPTTDMTLAAFEPLDKFYLCAWARDLRHHFPFLEERELAHPYQAFYYIWRLSHLLGSKLADVSLRFEDIVRQPVATVGAMLDRLDVAGYDPQRIATLFERPELGKWSRYASADWFRRHEARCEAVLAERYGELHLAPTAAAGPAASGLRG